jgi:hypothetical protein
MQIHDFDIGAKAIYLVISLPFENGYGIAHLWSMSHDISSHRSHFFTMRNIVRSLLLALIFGTVAASDDLALGITNYGCSGGGWNVTNFQYTCSGDNGDCGFGNKLTATGSIYIGQKFTDETVNVTLKVGVWGVAVVSVGSSSQRICDFLTPSDGTCGAVDTYTFSEKMSIPDDNMLQSALNINFVSVTAKLVIGNVSTCSATVTSVASSSSYSLAYVASSVVVGTLLVGVGVYGIRRRRLRVVQNESLKRTLTDFEMAPDPMNRIAMV